MDAFIHYTLAMCVNLSSAHCTFLFFKGLIQRGGERGVGARCGFGEDYTKKTPISLHLVVNDLLFEVECVGSRI